MLVEMLTLAEAVERDLPTPDVYFSPHYGASEEESGLSWRTLALDDRWLLPLVVHEQDGYLDAASPYGYAGVFAADSMSTVEQIEAWNSAQAVLADAGIVSLFLRRSPLVGQGWLPDNVTWVVRDHPTCAVQVGPTDKMWSSMEGRCRTSIRKAERLGLAVDLRPARAEDVEAGSPFRRLYEGAMRRREAAPRYFFPDSYYDRLLWGLGDSLLIGAVRREGEPIAAALFMRHDPFLHYHLSGALPEAGSLGATNLLIWSACLYAARSGLKTLHLGGGIAGRDSLYKFKRSFGGRELSFSAAGVVIHRSAYDERVAKTAEQLQVSAEALAARSGFPAYRQGAGA